MIISNSIWKCCACACSSSHCATSSMDTKGRWASRQTKTIWKIAWTNQQNKFLLHTQHLHNKDDYMSTLYTHLWQFKCTYTLHFLASCRSIVRNVCNMLAHVAMMLTLLSIGCLISNVAKAMTGFKAGSHAGWCVAALLPSHIHDSCSDYSNKYYGCFLRKQWYVYMN